MRGLRSIAASATGSAIMALLAMGFFAAIVLLILHIQHEPKLDYAIVGELLLVAVLALEGIVAVSHLRQSKLDSLHVLIEVHQDFRSAEMMLAIVSLWRFRRDHGDNFVKAYLESWRRDDAMISALPPENQIEAMKATLHYRRRMVKEFYNLLAGLYELRVLPAEVVYTYWSAAELKIIPEVLIPLEMAVARELRTEVSLGGWFQRLQKLYDDQPEATAENTIAPREHPGHSLPPRSGN